MKFGRVSFYFATALTVVVPIGLCSQPAFAQSVPDELRRLQKCYAMFVKKRIQTSDPLWTSVSSGSMSGTDACMSIFDQAQLNSNGKISHYTGDPDSDVGSRVLESFLEFQRSQFTVPEYTSVIAGGNLMTADLIDANDPSYHFLYSLFKPGESFSNVVTRDSNVMAIRHSQTQSHSRRVTSIGTVLSFVQGHTIIDTGVPGGNRISIRSADSWNVVPAQVGELVGLTEDTRNNVLSVGDANHNDPILHSAQSTVASGHTLQYSVNANTGTAPFTYSLLFEPVNSATNLPGGSSINSSTGVFTAGSVAGTFGVMVTDAVGRKAFLNNSINTGTSNTGGAKNSTAFPYSFGEGVNITASYGAGLIGTQAYLLGNNDKSGPVTGGTNAYRVWAKNVLSDLLCRTVPVLRSSDVLNLNLVQPSSNLPFRQGISCMQCHGSMDPMAGAIRQLRVGYAAYQDGSGGIGVKYYAPAAGVNTQPAAAYPEMGEDASFYKRPPDSGLLYRSYDGTLVSKSVTGLRELGQALAQTNDLYVCAAKHYYKFLTGIDADLSDLTDPINAPQLTDGQMNFRKKVIALGMQLKQDQSLRSMIRSIIASPTFINPDYGK